MDGTKLTRSVGIYLYDQVEVLDFAGPFEVFMTASRVHQRQTPKDPIPFLVRLIAENKEAVNARAGMRVLPESTIHKTSTIDVLIVPGGVVDDQLKRPDVITWLARISQTAELVASVCTGAFLLAKAGLLEGVQATTHWEDLEFFASMFPEVEVLPERRWVDQGRIVTAAGISAGIDMSLHLVRRLQSEALAEATARQMDYRWIDDG